MAATLTILSASAYSAKYLYSYDGAASGTAVRTQAQVIADHLAAYAGISPLRMLLEATTEDADWTALQRESTLSAYILPLSADAETILFGGVVVVVPDGRVFQVAGIDGVAATGILEVRFNHSYDR